MCSFRCDDNNLDELITVARSIGDCHVLAETIELRAGVVFSEEPKLPRLFALPRRKKAKV